MKIASLVLIFKYYSERLSLQIFRKGKRMGLTAQHHKNQDEEDIFWKHIRTWRYDKETVSRTLPKGGCISASVRVTAAEFPKSAGRHELTISVVPLGEPRGIIHVVEATFSATTPNRRRPGDICRFLLREAEAA